MIEILKSYWSKSNAFLLPLTGLQSSQKYPMKSYLFWQDYSIENYQLILQVGYINYEDFLRYCKISLFPTLDRGGYLMESYDFDRGTIFILDISEWAMDIQMFMVGKYSKFSKQAKEKIISYHTFYDKGPKVMIEISASLDPNGKFGILGGQSAIEYVAENYGLPLEELRKVGELGGIYDKEKETLREDILHEEGNMYK